MSEVYVYKRTPGTTVAATRELVEGCVFADCDAAGNLVGVEVLGAHSVTTDGGAARDGLPAAATRYLLAKYTPDLMRNEPRNVGVVAWSPEGVEARFLGETPGRPGEVGEGTVPPFARSASAYRQWVRYWRKELAGGTPPPALALASPPGNYVLAGGGFALGEVPPGGLPALADRLFAELVEPCP
jgi:uncharacterized protein YuzE